MKINKFYLPIIMILILVMTIPVFAWVSPDGYELTEEEQNYLYNKIDDCAYKKDFAHRKADIAREHGLMDESDYIQSCKLEWHDADSKQKYYESFLEKFDEHPTATIVWIYMHDSGYNDYICAGILGSMMVECGGLTLNLDADIYADCYYGLCMWNVYGYYEVCEMSLLEQMDFLFSNIEYEFDTYGWLYSDWMSYKSFLNLDTVYDATMSFTQCYERCWSGSYNHRVDCAFEAFDYFCY